jgi:hypothetical protein
MGLFPPISDAQREAFETTKSLRDETIAKHGYKPLKGWFGKLCEEFYQRYKYSACCEKDGKIYAWIQVLVLLGLEYADDSDFSKQQRKKWIETRPVDGSYWLERKEVLKKELGINYD